MKNIFPLIMSLVMLGILVAANFYLTRKFGWIFSLEKRGWLHLLFAVLPVFMIGGMIGFSNTTGMAGTLLYGMATIITGVMLYLVLSFLVVDVVQLLIKLKPPVYGAVAGTLTALVVLYGLWNAFNTRLTEKQIPIEGLKDEVKVMHLSDIHLGHFRGVKFLQKLVDMTIKQDPDLIVITGDLFDGRKQLKPETLEPLKQIGVPVFFVEGNHDGYTGVARVKELLREAGVQVLENEIVRWGELQIIGLNHLQADGDTRSVPPNPTGKSIRGVLSTLDIKRDIPAILLHHSPDGIKYA
ncbi:MAG: metallophosphoesterase, partial [Bacteroidales bacterium]